MGFVPGLPACNNVSWTGSVAFARLLVSLSNFRVIRDFSSVVLLDFLGENELLVLENPWELVKESLPDALDRKQFGV